MSDENKWKLYNKEKNILFHYCIKNGLIRYYDDKLIKNLRHIYYGGLTASILLLHDKLSNGYCYDRGKLITLGFCEDDFKVVEADINDLRLNPKNIDKYRMGKIDDGFSNHCFAERTKSDGTTWVYDTSLGLVFEKNIYYSVEKPTITRIMDKEEVLNFLYYDFQRDSNIDQDKYALPLILPNLEDNMIPTQKFYLNQFKEEIEFLKQETNYDSVCKEIEEDMKIKRKM